jgi:hypothetical protein
VSSAALDDTRSVWHHDYPESIFELAPRPAGTTEGADRAPLNRVAGAGGRRYLHDLHPPAAPVSGIIPPSLHYSVGYQTWSRVLAEPLQGANMLRLLFHHKWCFS